MKKIVVLLTLLALLLAFGTALTEGETGETAAPSNSQTETLPADLTETEADASAQEEDDDEELKWYTVAIIAALIAAVLILFIAGRRTRWDSRTIAMGAMCISIAFVLSCMKISAPFAQGGSITPASMLPIVIFVLAFGPLKGFAAGCAYGLLQLVQDPYVIHPIQLLVDYPLAFGALALCFVALKLPLKRKILTLPCAVLFAGIGRYIMAVISGTVFFASYAGDQNALIYSLVYNISYLGPDVVICMLVSLIPGIADLVRAANPACEFAKKQS